MTETLRLDRDEARRIAVRAAALAGSLDDDADDAPTSVVEVAGRLEALRVELTSTVAPAADHIAFTRLGHGHRPSATERALADGRLFEHRWRLRPIADLGLHLASIRASLRPSAEEWIEANAPFRQGLLDRIADDGPSTSRDLPDEAIVPWPSSGWTNDRNVTQMLELLHARGELAVVGRDGRFRIWDLAERVLPSDVVVVPIEEARRIRAGRLLSALGIARQRAIAYDVGSAELIDVGVPAEVDGVPGRWRVDAALVGGGFAGRTAILSPFDPLVMRRERLAELFDYEYALEMYTPKAKRRWGAFALPVLHGDRLVGKVDARADRRRGTLDVAAVHEDVRLTTAARDAVDDELESLAAWLGLRLARA